MRFLIWITSLSPCRDSRYRCVLWDAPSQQSWWQLRVNRCSPVCACSSSLGLCCLQWRKRNNGGSSLPPQPGGQRLFLKLAKGEMSSLLSCWLLKSSGWLSQLVILYVPAQTQHLTAWQSLMWLSSAPWDTEECVHVFSLCFMDEKWSRDAKAQPDCLAHSHQRNPQQRKEPVTKYFSCIQRSSVALATRATVSNREALTGTGRVSPSLGSPWPGGREIPWPRPAPQPCSQVPCLGFMSPLHWSLHLG